MLTLELFEMHFSDLYPRSFSAFIAKYAPLADDPTIYVNFTDVVGDPINKTFSPKPNHGDPTGLYCYPLNYVINHPSEIEYGQQARFLRVIKDQSRHKLDLTTMTKEQAIELLTRMGVQEPERRMAMMQRSAKYAFGNIVAKQFFGVLQYGLAPGQRTRTSNAEQNALLRKAGIDAIEDRSPSKHEAIIYEDEPEQCVFLSRASFKVIEVFELRSESSRVIYRADPRERLRRLPGLIAQAIGDRIVANNLTGERGERMSFYTAAQRKIVVMMDAEYRFLVGHRQGSDHSGDQISVAIMGPDFQTVSATYPKNASFEQIAADVAERFAHRQPGQGESYDVLTEYGPEIRQVNETLTKVAAKLRLPFTAPQDQATAYRVYATVRAIESEYGLKYNQNREALIDYVQNIVARFWRKDRKPQGQQILAIWQKAATKRIGIGELHYLKKIAERLGIAQPAQTRTEDGSYARQYGDLTIFRRGSELMAKIGEHEQQIADIDNLKLERWQQPHGSNYRLFLPYAKDFCAYLNEFHFVVNGYATYLPQYYGISFVDDRWYPTDEVSEKLATAGGVSIIKLPPDAQNRSWVAATMDGETDWRADHGPGGAVEKWRSMLLLYDLNDNNELIGLGHDVQQFYERENHRKKYSNQWWGNNPVGEQGSSTRATWEALQAAGFNVLDFIKQQGYKFSSKMTYELPLFGLVLNQDNGKTGAKYRDVMNPVGKFNGIELYSVVPTPDHGSRKNRYYFLKRDDKWKEVAQCERDWKDGSQDMKLVHVTEDLSNEERKAVGDLLAHRQVAIPAKFRKNLSIRKRQ